MAALGRQRGRLLDDAFARVYHADGTPLTGEIAVNASFPGNQGRPVVAGLADGRFVVAWRDDSSGNFDIKARVDAGSAAGMILEGSDLRGG